MISEKINILRIGPEVNDTWVVSVAHAPGCSSAERQGTTPVSRITVEYRDVDGKRAAVAICTICRGESAPLVLPVTGFEERGGAVEVRVINPGFGGW